MFFPLFSYGGREKFAPRSHNNFDADVVRVTSEVHPIYDQWIYSTINYWDT